MAQSLRRSVGLVGTAAGVVALGAGASLAVTGASPAQAFAGGLLVGVFALVVVPLALIARQVGSSADDPAAIERRMGAAAGRSRAELDALAEWDERRGRLDDAPDRHPPDRE